MSSPKRRLDGALGIRASMQMQAVRKGRSGVGRGSRYTRSVGWRHRIAVILLTVLAGLPVSGSVCAMACGSAAPKASHHHGSGKNCEEAAAPSTGLQFRGVSEHDCSTHDAAVRQLITTTAQRSDAFAIGAHLAAAIVQLTLDASSSTDSGFDYSPPPKTAPPTTTPLVLRV